MISSETYLSALQGALDLWTWIVEKVYFLLTLDLEGFSPTVYQTMRDINGALQAFGYGFLIIFTMLEIVRTCGSFQEVKTHYRTSHRKAHLSA